METPSSDKVITVEITEDWVQSLIYGGWAIEPPVQIEDGVWKYTIIRK